MKSEFILMPFLLWAWLALVPRAHGITTLTITVTNLPGSGRTASLRGTTAVGQAWLQAAGLD